MPAAHSALQHGGGLCQPLHSLQCLLASCTREKPVLVFQLETSFICMVLIFTEFSRNASAR